MSKLILTAFAAAAVLAVTSSANARPPGGDCDEFGCGLNGTQITGVVLPSASTGTVSSVILPSGETVDLR